MRAELVKQRPKSNLKGQYYYFELSAEFGQFYLQDELAEGEVDWNEQEASDNLALSFGIIAVGTNCDRIVPVEVQILSSEPPLNMEPWDNLVECRIDVPAGRLVVLGCVEDFARAARINLKPGSYRARVCYGNQYSCNDYIGCSDYYVVMLWRSNDKVFEVLKRRVDVFCSVSGLKVAVENGVVKYN